ncbi:MAG TPA: cobalt ECF transporter T component CbiQ [Desulfuromonadales bacterium]|nr:cobalt ECF transporter T component CbiQ [Desulfuromonadales bacterium]
MRIDNFAYSNRWRNVSAAEKGLFTLLCLIATLIAQSPLPPLVVALLMVMLTVFGAGIPWREYLRISAAPLFFILWSCLILALSFSGGGFKLCEMQNLGLSVFCSRKGGDLALLTLSRSTGATLSLLFLALTTPITEITGLLRYLGSPRLLTELLTITYRQIFIFFEIAGQVRAAQESRLGYASSGRAMRSLAGMAGSVLLGSLDRARQNHQGLLARGYDGDLHQLSPRCKSSFINLARVILSGAVLMALSVAIKP